MKSVLKYGSLALAVTTVAFIASSSDVPDVLKQLLEALKALTT